jgi:hypothetical protein
MGDSNFFKTLFRTNSNSSLDILIKLVYSLVGQIVIFEIDGTATALNIAIFCSSEVL